MRHCAGPSRAQAGGPYAVPPACRADVLNVFLFFLAIFSGEER
jgi:hypothetical protein